MTITIEEKFNNDLFWLLSELKQEEMANAYSEHKIKFFLIYTTSDSEPKWRSQKRILKMLQDREALSLKPFYHNFMTILDSVLEMQGAEPLGYYIQIKQPQFDEILEKITKQKPKPLLKLKTNETDKQSIDKNNSNEYFISLSNARKVLLNNTLVLSTPNFNTENHQFIEYIIEHPDQKLKKVDIEKDTNIKLKKNFHSTISDLGFKGEIRKLFFQVSKTTVCFRNNISEEELPQLEIDTKKLNKELSGLERTDKKEEESKGNKEK